MVTAVKTNGIAPVSNDASSDILATIPYVASLEIEGASALLFHRWSNEAVAEKAAAAKNSKAKKTDNVESYVYRTPDGDLGIPGEWVRMSLVNTARYRQDPRSPRKSAMDLFKAGLVCLTEVSSLGKSDWDYLDARRVVVQRSAVTRLRPAILPGWRVSFDLQVLLPEYIDPSMLQDIAALAGRVTGIGDFRPTYGRFHVTHFEIR